MSYEGCCKCNKDITNDEQFYLCRNCWDKYFPDVKFDNSGRTIMEEPNDPLEKLIEKCNEGFGGPLGRSFFTEHEIEIIKLLAERLRGLEILVDGRHNVDCVEKNDTRGSISIINKCIDDFEERIKRLEKAVSNWRTLAREYQVCSRTITTGKKTR